MDISAVESAVKDFLVNELEISEDKIYADSRLKEDMGIDSLEVVDVIVLVQQEFGIKLRPEDFKTLSTFSQFCEHIASAS